MEGCWCFQNYLLTVLFLHSAVLGDLDCTYNSLKMMSCTWNVGNNFSSTPCFIEAKLKNYRKVGGSCWLAPAVKARQCTFPISGSKNSKNQLTVSHVLDITVSCGSVGCANYTVASLLNYSSFSNLRLDPPQSLVISLTKDGLWNLTWSSSYSYYIGNNVEYEVVYKPSKDPWLEAKTIPIRQNDLWVCLQSLQPGTLYEARVKVNQMEFQGGRWSDFSQPLQWRTLPKYSTYSTSKIMQVVLPCTAALIFIILLPLIICSSHRVKKIFWVHVPDPSRFFDPLIFTHKGDFQKWLSTPFDFSAFSLEPTPINISPVDIIWHKDKYPPKVLPLGINETLTDSSGQSFSSFSNQGYFFFQFPNITEDDASSNTQPSYGCLEQRDISPMLQNLPLPSTVTCEGTQLFCADYFSDPKPVGIGIQNRSFEIDSMVNLPQSSTLKQMVKEKVSGELPEVPCCPTGEDKCEMKERVECDNLNTAAQVITEHVQPSSQEIDMTRGYFTLNAFYQQHYSNWV